MLKLFYAFITGVMIQNLPIKWIMATQESALYDDFLDITHIGNLNFCAEMMIKTTDVYTSKKTKTENIRIREIWHLKKKMCPAKNMF